MNWIKDIYRQLTSAVPRLEPGIYTTYWELENEPVHRLHLRVEGNGTGLLIVDAATVLHLNETATDYAYHLIQNTDLDETAYQTSRRYKVSKNQAIQDFNDFKERILTLIQSPDLDPVSYLDFDRMDVHTGQLTAPLRLDCALTYHSNTRMDDALGNRVKRELMTDEWQDILTKAWNGGVPHVIFTGGEPTMRPDLHDLVVFAEKLGMVTGVLTDGLQFTNPEYLHQMLAAGLDHIMILLDPLDEQSWEALRDLLAEDIFVTVHLTINSDIIDTLPQTLHKLSEMGVKSISLTADDAWHKADLDQGRLWVAELGMSLVWDLPVPYSVFNPISMELEEGEGMARSGAGKSWLYVEPDGDVLPGQGINQIVGNLRYQSIQEIWKSVQETA